MALGEHKKVALKFLLKILAIIHDSISTMQIASGCRKRINCDEHPAATAMFLA